IVKFHKRVDMIHGRVRASKAKTMQDAIEVATKLMNKKISTLVECQTKNKKRLDNTSKNNQNQQQPNKRQNTGIAYTARHGEKKHYSRSKSLCSKCNYHHNGSLKTLQGTIRTNNNKTKGRTLVGITLLGLMRRNLTEGLNLCALNATITMMVHVLLNATSATELAIWPVTVRVLQMPILLTTKGAPGQVRKLLALSAEPKDISRGSVQIRRTTTMVINVEMAMHQQKYMWWALQGQNQTLTSLRENETLIICGDGSYWENETRLNIISCTKTQKYMLKGCYVFLAHVTTKKAEDKSKEKRLEDVPIIQDFPKVFSGDFLGLPPTRQVEF
nr:reverse transcriptase domain-containing protein [Tanacetum cinerariifolium]